MLLTIAAFYSSADGLPTLKRYKDETGTNLFPTTAPEVRDIYNRLCKGFDVDQFQLLTVVLSVFAVDLGIDSNTIGFNSKVATDPLLTTFPSSPAGINDPSVENSEIQNPAFVRARRPVDLRSSQRSFGPLNSPDLRWAYLNQP